MSISYYSLVIRHYSAAVDVPQTWADVTHEDKLFGYKPTTSFKDGVAVFYDWWKASCDVR